jgi:hypothetical protein
LEEQMDEVLKGERGKKKGKMGVREKERDE